MSAQPTQSAATPGTHARKPKPYHPPGEWVKVIFWSYAQDDDPLADFDLEPAQFAVLKRAARKQNLPIAEFIKRGFLGQLAQLEASIAGGAR